MPRLKKYSEIYGDDISSKLSIPNSVASSSNNSYTYQNNNTRDNKQKRQSQSSGQSSSQIQSKSQQTSNNNQESNSKYQQKVKQKNKSTQKKYSSRIKQSISKYNHDQILKKMQQQCAKNEEQQQYNQKDDNQTNVDIPDDVLVGFEKKKRQSKSNKQNKSGLRFQNKFFNNLEISEFQLTRKSFSNIHPIRTVPQEGLQQLSKLEQQQKQMQAIKNEKALQAMNQRKNQLEQKVSRIRQRLQFKNAHDDVRFKQHIKQTLQNVKDCEQVDIMIQAPKIFKGTSAKQTDAALLIKHMSSTYQSQCADDISHAVSRSLSKQKSQKEDKNHKNKKIGRKEFYQQFTKQVKQTRAVQFPVANVTNCLFKKTQLDEVQYQKNQHLFKEKQDKDRNSITSRSNSRLSVQRQKQKYRKSLQNKQKTSKQSNGQLQNGNSMSKIPIKINEFKQIKPIQQDKQSQQSKPLNKGDIKQKEQNIKKQQVNRKRSKTNKKSNKKRQYKSQNENKVKQNKSQNTKPKKARKDKNKNKNNQKINRQIIGLFQLQAQQQSNGYGDNNGQSSESDDNQSLQQLIDRKKVKVVQKYERQARKKFRSDLQKKDQQIVQKIKERILYPRKIKCQYDQSSQSRQRRLQRMEQAKKKFQEQDGPNDGKLEQYPKQRDDRQQERQQAALQKHLKQLQDEQKAKGEKPIPSLLKSQQNKSKNKKPNIWKQIKLFTKVQPTNTQKGDKRGGFIAPSDQNHGKVAGVKISNKNNKKNKSKQKNINF